MEVWFLCIGIFFILAMEKKIKRLNRKIKKIEKVKKGDDSMSKLIKDLEGKKCTILQGEEIIIGKLPVYEILEVDEEWVKISSTDKKNIKSTKIIRIDDIQCINLVE